MLIETFGVVGNSDRPSFVRVELRIERGFLFRLSGLSTTAAKAAQTRIRSALLAFGNRWPGKGISVNIAPATELRNTTELDLPIALALLAAQGVIAPSTIKSTAFSGELSLDGSVVNSPKNDQLIISKEINDREKLKINSIFNSNGLHLKKKLNILQTNSPPANTTLFQNNRIIQINRNFCSDVYQSNNCAKRTLKTEIKTFLNLKGEHTAKRKALIAAAGRHNTIIIGPPGSGKLTLAKIIHSLLPDIKNNYHQNQEGLNESTRPPWRAPHSTTKPVGLIGSWKTELTDRRRLYWASGVSRTKVCCLWTSGQRFRGTPLKLVAYRRRQAKSPWSRRAEAPYLMLVHLSLQLSTHAHAESTRQNQQSASASLRRPVPM